jgi:hypothetical protein
VRIKYILFGRYGEEGITCILFVRYVGKGIIYIIFGRFGAGINYILFG